MERATNQQGSLEENILQKMARKISLLLRNIKRQIEYIEHIMRKEGFDNFTFMGYI